MKGSVFILVQVGLFIKVIILWRCKAILRNKGQNYYFVFFALFYFTVEYKTFLIKDDIKIDKQCPELASVIHYKIVLSAILKKINVFLEAYCYRTQINWHPLTSFSVRS